MSDMSLISKSSHHENSWALYYSVRRVDIGSVAAALRAGMYEASSAMTRTSRTTEVMITGSVGLT